MYCKNCGKLVEEGNKFCPYCGTKVIETENKVEKAVLDEAQTDGATVQEKPKENTKQDNMEENQDVPKKKSHLVRNVVIAVAALCVVGYAVSGSQNKNKLSQEKTDIIEKLKENTSLQSEYFEQWDGTNYSFYKGDDWEVRYSEENVSVRIAEPEIQECFSTCIGTDELGNDGTFAYRLTDNDINIYLDTEIPEGNLTIVMYDVAKDEYTLMIDGDKYTITDELKDYLDQYGLREIMLNDVNEFKDDLSSMDLTTQDLLKLDNTDIAKYLEKGK
ncbi:MULTISPECIES: zinc ribbon domain-containing protein [unclassified Ruminococcus]|uniref:zinc ribbon domain-containing protein n=1 Tax=unclassified Ruminococcus TaxID=2608920 RepID=UPI00319E6C35|nr:zinc ribbon domain-containing protein [Clostridia bacterium]